MFISKFEKDYINEGIDGLEDAVDHLLDVADKQEKRIADLEAIIETLTDLFSAEINARVGKKCAELTADLATKVADGLQALDKAFKDIKVKNKKKTAETETKKVGRPKKESK